MFVSLYVCTYVPVPGKLGLSVLESDSEIYFRLLLIPNFYTLSDICNMTILLYKT